MLAAFSDRQRGQCKSRNVKAAFPACSAPNVGAPVFPSSEDGVSASGPSVFYRSVTGVTTA